MTSLDSYSKWLVASYDRVTNTLSFVPTAVGSYVSTISSKRKAMSPENIKKKEKKNNKKVV